MAVIWLGTIMPTVLFWRALGGHRDVPLNYYGCSKQLSLVALGHMQRNI